MLKNFPLSVKVLARSVLLIVIIGIHGCAFFELEEELKVLDQAYALKGKVHNESPHQENVIVVLFQESSGQIVMTNATITEPTGNYSFGVYPGAYYIGAFEDHNNNLSYDPGEYIGFHGRPDKVVVKPIDPAGRKPGAYWNLDVTIGARSGPADGFPEDIKVKAETLSQSLFSVGTIANLDDEKFSLENAEKGYWRPLTFLNEVRFGIYFVEEYDPQKIPILFVHGAVGTPKHFQSLVNHLDGNRFQYWFTYYPSGLPLENISHALNLLVHDLHDTYRFSNLVVAAHSMGGLVARSLILENVYRDKQDYIKLLITVSTPWNGHPMAEMGVKQAPTVIPSWTDTSPNSRFIESVFAEKLPPTINHHLFFSFKGDCSRFMANNDGSVELESQLDDRAQQEAKAIYGFNEGHVDILQTLKFFNQFEAVLDQGIGERGVRSSHYGISN